MNKLHLKRRQIHVIAAVTFGNAMSTPALHMCAGNMTLGIHTAAEQLHARGYRRIGLAVTQWVDARSDHTYSGAMLTYQQQTAPRDRASATISATTSSKSSFVTRWK